MRKHKIVLFEIAKDDLKEARKWYNERQKGLGKRLNLDMKKTLLAISNNPYSFAIRYDEFRRANFSTFPYAAYFLVDEANYTVYIAAFIHSGRGPNTAKERL